MLECGKLEVTSRKSVNLDGKKEGGIRNLYKEDGPYEKGDRIMND